METALIFGTLKILPPQRQHALVISPEKEGNDRIKGPRANHLAPNCVGRNVEHGHRREGTILGHCITRALCEIERDHQAAADDAQEDKDIPAHLGEANKHGRIEANAVDQCRLLGPQHRLEPGEESPTHWRRSVFVIGMFHLGRIDDRMARAEEGEQ